MASPRMMLLVAQIARMRVAGLKDSVIAQALNRPRSTIYRIVRTTDYQEYESAILEGHISKMDEALAGKVELIQKKMRHAVPMAVQTIIDVAKQRKDLKAALAAAKDILEADPDNTFNKDVAKGNTPGQDLPTTLFESIAKDADGVSASVKQKMKEGSELIN